MGKRARSQRSLAAAVATAALVVSGGAVTPLLAAGTAVAAPLPPWQEPLKVGPTGDFGDLRVTTAADGSAVAGWYVMSGMGMEIRVAVRPAGTDHWGPSTKLATVPTSRGDESFKLVPDTDGRVTAIWPEYPSDQGTDSPPMASLLKSATLSQGTWSQPATLLDLPADEYVGTVELAAGPRGTATAVWTSRPTDADVWKVNAADRTADGTWSKPATVASSAVGGGFVSGADVAVDPQGTAVVAFLRTTVKGDSGRINDTISAVETVTRTAPGAAWGTPVAHTPQSRSLSAPRIASGPTGMMALSWTKSADDSSALESVNIAVRPSAAAGWGAPAKTPGTSKAQAASPEPLIAGDGDVTVVWPEVQDRVGGGTKYVYFGSTLRTADGTWQKQQLSDNASDPWAPEAAIGPDGTVRVMWSEWVSSEKGWHLRHSARTSSDDQWTGAGEVIPGTTGFRLRGVVSAGPYGSATLLANINQREEFSSLISARATAEVPLGIGSSTVPATVPLAGSTGSNTVWAPVWNLTRPVSAWSVVLTDSAGRTVANLAGTGPTEKAAPAWKGRTQTGALPVNGPLTWTLKATAVNAPAPVTLGSGKVTVTGGAPAPRDFGSRAGRPDGLGDLLQTTATGLRTAYGSTGAGNFSGSVTTTGWSKGFRPVPMGDMNGDRCNDTLVRLATGEMRAYTPACGTALKPAGPYKVLGKGWTIYDVLTSPGDVTKDGRPDLVARDPKSGALYLYTTTKTGALAPRVSLGTGFKSYKKIVGAGDLNGDGIGDLLLQDQLDNLWRSYGTGAGKFGARGLVAREWGASYNAVVGVGDLTGDGRADLIARDRSGGLWRYSGTGRGTLDKRVKIAIGWQAYAGIH
ncbi:VCBS repeat-containing protein [Streptomyces bambusae]|uniref:FG-GAP repeat domain-containing protein n=1 Tax=Streptomyces bambusae TaxID=1550616 RepID=UPI001CFDF999|nr:VCBS repeat-containing protein [Streptomyces bambusae]MCB5165026.1 VCBS repeat-containing protein [Streptomyces bambusae]